MRFIYFAQREKKIIIQGHRLFSKAQPAVSQTYALLTRKAGPKAWMGQEDSRLNRHPIMWLSLKLKDGTWSGGYTLSFKKYIMHL